MAFEIEDARELKELLYQFNETARKLNAVWLKSDREIGSSSYPFQHSFDEVAFDITDWIADFVNDLSDWVCVDCNEPTAVNQFGDNVCRNPDCFLYYSGIDR